MTNCRVIALALAPDEWAEGTATDREIIPKSYNLWL